MNTTYKNIKSIILGSALALFLSTAVTGLALANGGFIKLSTYYAMPEQDVQVQGENFPPNENVSVTLGAASQNTQSNAGGIFSSGNFKIPYSAAQSTVEVKAETQNETAKTSLVVGGFYPNVTPNAWYVVRGGKVWFAGQGFAPNEKVKVKANGQDWGEVESNSSGSFSSPEYALPYQGGQVTFAFIGVSSNASSSRTVHVAGNQPHIVLSTYYAPGGSRVVVTGHDFGSGEAVNLNFEGLNFGSPIANSAGKFTHVITVPSSSGKKNIQAQGLTTNLSANAIFTIASF
ncbi:MAG: hypothetical protein JNN11_05350 [Candidatus Doudnabacteria bacterium]|nr:hypothetical protein [Candidatus Doudnabacteria bacterium]